jgi:hypothetical protein
MFFASCTKTEAVVEEPPMYLQVVAETATGEIISPQIFIR